MIAQPNFKQVLKWGQVGETVIACWLRYRGWTILPVYEKVIDTGKGPCLHTAYRSGHGELIAPDMLTFKEDRIQWVEGKRKTAFSWRWKRQVWQDGIDLHHYRHYLHVREHSRFPLWLLFFHENAQPSEKDKEYGCPSTCPTGLYGGEITYLKTVIAHEDAFQVNGRAYPMVYWNIEHLMPHGKPLATLDEMADVLRRVS